MPSFQELLSAVKSKIREISVEETKARALDAPVAAAPVLIDVRERDEYEQGFIPRAQWIPRGFLELEIEDAVPERDREVILYCAGGTRSALAARSRCMQLGYAEGVVDGGRIPGVEERGLRVRSSARRSRPSRIKRYSRHIMLPEVGEAGQAKLLDAKVLFIGAGGLGSPSSLYLAAAGVGTIGMVDDDVVDESNLQRQVLHNIERLGMPKVDSARKTLQRAQPRREGDPAPDAAVLREHHGDPRRLRLRGRRRRQLPDALPAQRRRAQAAASR